MDNRNTVGAALVVGGGIAGIQASLDLAESGIKVYLVEKSPAIGGKMAQLDKTFPTNDCSTCILSPKLVECGRHPNIEIITNAQLTALTGEAGDFTATVLRRPPYVNHDLCTGCGACFEACVYKRAISEFNEGLGKRTAIYMPYPQAVPLVATIDPESCLLLKRGKCVQSCVKACMASAIDFAQTAEERHLRIGAVIIAAGYDLYDAHLSEEFGFGRYPNVVTSMQFERTLSASGPTRGHIRRPSDQETPKKIAFLQCVGSRDQNHSYCSAVCCMYATKESMLAQEHNPGLECSIFIMDMRPFGKGFEAYYQRAKKQGVRYVRCRPSSLKEDPASKDVIVRYVNEDGKIQEEKFGLVVLSVGMEPSRSGQELARTLGVEMDHRGFGRTVPFHPTESSRPGVLICGCFAQPKDIPDTVTEASGAAAQALRLIGQARGTEVTEKTYPAEMSLDKAEPRVGVFVCHCGTNIAGVVNVPSVVELARTLPHVVHAENVIYACSADSLKSLPEKIAAHGLNRVVIASCSPRTHEPLFRETLREAGLNPYLFEMANIRDQCSWVHSSQPEAATAKSDALVRMAVARASLLEPLHKESLDINHQALVIGGGVAGMTAALSLADQGTKVYLVEREKEVGGHLRFLNSTVQGGTPQEHLSELVERIGMHPLIEVLTGTKVASQQGFVGNFKTTVASVEEPTQRLIEHGVTIVATGLAEYRGSEFHLDADPRVLTQGDLERKLAQTPDEVLQAKTVVMIQCVGPWEKQDFYCSRLCCALAAKNAIRIKELNAAAQVYVLFKDVRTYGFSEELYTQARQKGVLFIRYTDDRPPRLESTEEGLMVGAYEPILREDILLNPDLVVLSTAFIPAHGSSELASLLKVSLSREGFFSEAHIKLRPVDFASEGIFLCGGAHYPKFIEESMAQGAAAAARATTILSQRRLLVGGAIAQVEEAKCTACLTCVRVCPYDVPFINADGVAEIEAAKCLGCGICAAECPAKAIQLLHYRDEQMVAKTDALLEGVGA
ncbi:MAG: CoB--CoM heterodisulfide reductase iron-sulfur subunit A family protein [Chloroflexi bacterium]|nr:CoB--CoM heterodisulfide reductase iron-sulfur subunit A family protein [Chloroflexota bacterium]